MYILKPTKQADIPRTMITDGRITGAPPHDPADPPHSAAIGLSRTIDSATLDT